MGTIKGDFQRQLALLRGQFTDSLNDKFSEMEETFQILVNQTDSVQTLHRLLLKAHNMSGTSASFGYTLLGERAKRLEFFLKKIEETQGPPNGEQFDRISEMLTSLREAADLTRWELEEIPEEKLAVSKPAVPGNRKLYLLDKGRMETESLTACLALIGYSLHVFNETFQLTTTVSEEAPAAILIDWNALSSIDPTALETFSGSIPILCLTTHGDPTHLDRLDRIDVTRVIDPTDFSAISDVLLESSGGPIPDPYRILLIDDDPVRAEHHAYLFENAGMWTRIASNPREITSSHAAFRPEMVWVTLGDEPLSVRGQLFETGTVLPPRAYFCPESLWEKRGFALRNAGQDVFPLPPDQTRLIWFTAGKAMQTRQFRDLASERQALLAEPPDLISTVETPGCHTDPTGRITRVNDKFLDSIGLPVREILGRDIRSWIDPGDHFWAEMIKGRTWASSHEGKPFSPCNCQVIPFSDEGGPVRLVWLFFTNHVAKKKNGSPAKTSPVSGSVGTGWGADTNKPRVLLVEDNPVNRKILSRLLDQAGYVTDCAINGEEAVAAFKRGNHGLILMDCRMPVMDGLTATAEIRKLERIDNRVVIIALTADESNANRAECIRAGMDDHLTKPVEPGALLLLLEKFLGGSKSEIRIRLSSEKTEAAVGVAFDLLRRAVRQCDATAIEVRFGLIHHFFTERKLTDLAAMIQASRRESKTVHAWTLLDWINSVETEYRRFRTQLEQAGKNLA